MRAIGKGEILNYSLGDGGRGIHTPCHYEVGTHSASAGSDRDPCAAGVILNIDARFLHIARYSGGIARQ